jgi:hypothetical protein
MLFNGYRISFLFSRHSLTTKILFMKTRFTFCLVFAFCISITITTKAQVDKDDSLALVVLYNSTDGPLWTHHDHWLAGPVKDWYGIGVTDQKVISINLSNNNLNGNIPISLVQLKKLSSMDLSHNNLNGNISPKLSYLFNLNNGSGCYLDLSYNQLSGNIPAQFGNICGFNLDGGYVDLSHNRLSGKIPPKLNEFCGASWYGGYLNLSHNQLSGSIPPEFAYIYSSGSGIFDVGGGVDLSYNQLSGNIPSFYWTDILYLNNNKLSGSIPELSGEHLYDLDLAHNQLSGSIPASIGDLYNLNYLRLSYNKLDGSIPDEISNNLYALQYLFLDHNKLSGKIPSSIALTNLDSLDLSNNHFTFDGMELVAKKFPFAKYNRQAIIPVHLNNNALSVSAGGTLAYNTYKWFKKGQPGYVTIKEDSVFHPTESGIYVVKVSNKIATQLNLISDTISYTAPSPHNGVACTKQQDLLNNRFSVYPNPAKNILHVTTNSNASFSLVSDDGKILLSASINKTGAINISDIAAGVYYLSQNRH